MSAYILRRILFMIPTLLGIMLVSFVVVQFAPGGPVERVIAQLSGRDTGASSRIPGAASGDLAGQPRGGSQIDAASTRYRGAQGLDPAFIKKLEKQFGFDKPLVVQYLGYVGGLFRGNLGTSYTQFKPVTQVVDDDLPPSWMKNALIVPEDFGAECC